jgi:hypothetical protein
MPCPSFTPTPSSRNQTLLHPILLLLCTTLLAAAAPPTAGDPASVPLAPPNAPPVPVPPPTNPGQDHPPGQITQISETRYQLGKIEFDQVKRTITFGATLNMNKGMLEYALVTEKGKVHEALLATEISPFNLNLALILLHYKPAKNFIPAGLLPPDKQPPPGAKPSPIDQSNGLDIRVSWKDKDGIKKTARIEDWVHNDGTQKKAEPSPFVYTGSQMDNGIYAAQASGSIIALYSDPVAIFNSPRKGNNSDEIWSVGSGVPPLQTTVQVTLHPHKAVVEKKGQK